MAEATFFRGSAASAATADPLVLDWPEEISPVPTLVPPAPIPAEGPLRKLTRSARLFYHWKIRKSIVLPYRPTEVGIELTNRCNFKCSFCPQSDPQHFDRVAPSAIVPGRARTLLKKLRDGGVDTRIIHWTLDGEPFMNKRFADVVREAVTLGFDTHHFATNAYLLTLDRMYEFPAEGQRYHLTPDFCSDRAYFETYRGTPGSWERVLENLRAALKDPGLAHLSRRGPTRKPVGDLSRLPPRIGRISGLRGPRTPVMTTPGGSQTRRRSLQHVLGRHAAQRVLGEAAPGRLVECDAMDAD